MIINFNTIEDIAGIIVTGLSFFVCVYYLRDAENILKAIRPCEAVVLKNREMYISSHIKTLFANAFLMAFFTFVLIHWLVLKYDTAPGTIDSLVFCLKIGISSLIIRSSICARDAILRLSIIRKADIKRSETCPCCDVRDKKEI